MEGNNWSFTKTTKASKNFMTVGYWNVHERKTWTGVLFLGLLVLSANRMSLPVTIVEIAEELNWDKRTCGIILSSFYWGYLLPQVVGGWVADRYGGDRLLWMAGLVWSLVGLSIAYLAYVSIFAIFTARFIVGLSQGVHYPALIGLVTKHMDPKERNFYYGLMNTGAPLGTVALGSIGSLLLSVCGWPLVFIAVGVLGVMWAVSLRAVSNMSKCTKLQKDKLDSASLLRARDVPWRKILTNPAVLAANLVHFCDSFSLHCLLSWAPTYFHNTFPSMENSAWLYNSLPWLSIALGSIISGWVVHWMVCTGRLSMTFARKVVIGANLGLQCVFLVAMATVDQNNTNFNFTVALMFLMFVSCGHGLSAAGASLNLSDLIPEYTGAIYGVMNSIATLPGILGVSFVGYILHLTSSWSLVFCIMAAINVPGLVVYMVFGSAKNLHLEQ